VSILFFSSPLIALWRYLETGVVPDGAQLKPMEV